MATTCSVCPEAKKPSVLLVWCQVCGDLLCESCSDQHKHSEHTRNHSLISYEDYQKLPWFILKIRPYCTEHKQLLSNFCRRHDQTICATCLQKSHRKCEDVPKIEDIVHKVKDSVLFGDTFLEMEAMCGTLKKLAHNRKKNLKRLKGMYQEMKKDFENESGPTMNHSKNLKDKKISDMDSVYDKLTIDISNTRQLIKSRRKKLRSILKQKQTIKEYASDYLTFLAVKTMEKLLHETNNFLSDLSDNDKFKDYSLTYDMNKTTDDIKPSPKDFTIIKGSSTVSIHTIGPRYLEAVKEVQTPPPVTLHLQQKIELKEGWYRGCCTLSSGLIVFADYHHDKIYIHKPNGSLRSIIKFESKSVYDVTPVDGHHVAVSHPKSHTISIIDVDKGFSNEGKIVKTLETRMDVRGLCCRGKDLVCCVPRKGLMKVNIDSEKIEIIVKDEKVDFNSYVQVGTNITCYTCRDNDTVTVLDTQYNVIFTYIDTAVLEYPTDVTMDDHSNIYVTGYGSDNLVMISSDGRACHKLLGKEDGLKEPTAVHYDSRTKELVVVNMHGPAFIYSVG